MHARAYRGLPTCCIRSATPWSGLAPALLRGNWANCTNRVRYIWKVQGSQRPADTGQPGPRPKTVSRRVAVSSKRVLRQVIRSAKGAARTTKQARARNLPAPHSVLREFLKHLTV